MSLEAAAALRSAGAEQFLFKYCSTFNSTDAGNIGPVADALLEFLSADLTVACPAFPANGRSIYLGHLFVGQMLLSDSPMKDHPLTPMRDANLVRVLQRQVKGQVGLIPFAVVERGAEAIRAGFASARAEGKRFLVVDAVSDGHLRAIGAASADLPLLTGGSGIAMGLPDNFRAAGKLAAHAPRETLTAPAGKPVVLAGSCSQATREQVRFAIAAGAPAFQVDPLAVAEGATDAARIAAWVRRECVRAPRRRLFERRSGRGSQSAGQAGRGARGRAGRNPPRRCRRVAARRRLHPLRRGGRRDLRRGRRRARRQGARDRAGDRSRRALDAQPRDAGRGVGVEVGKLRRAGFLFAGVDQLS